MGRRGQMKYYVIWIVAFATLANADITHVNSASKTEGKAFSEKSSFSSLSSVKSHHLDKKQSKQQEQFRREERHLDNSSSHQELKSQHLSSKTSTNAGKKSQVVKKDVTSTQSNAQEVKESSRVYATSSSQSTGCPHSHDLNRDKNITTVEKSSYNNQLSNQQKTSSIVTTQTSKSHNESDTKKSQSKTDTSMYTRNVKFIIHKEKKGYSEASNTTSSNSNTKRKLKKVSTASSSTASRSEFINETSVHIEENDYPKPRITVIRLKKKHDPKTNVDQSQNTRPWDHIQNRNTKDTNPQPNKIRNNRNNNKRSKVNKSKTSVKKNIRRTIIEETNEDYYCEKHRQSRHDAEEQPASETQHGAEQHNCNHTVQPQKPSPKTTPAPTRIKNRGKNKQIDNKRSKTAVKKKKVTIVKEIEEEVYCNKHSQRKRKANKKQKKQPNSNAQNTNSTGTAHNQTNNRSKNVSDTNNNEVNYCDEHRPRNINASETNKNDDNYCDEHRPKSQSDNTKTPDKLTHSNNQTKPTPNPIQNATDNKKTNFKRNRSKGVKRVDKSTVNKKKTHRTIIEESEENYYCDKHKEQRTDRRKKKNSATKLTGNSNLKQNQTSSQKQNKKSNIKRKAIDKKSVSKKKKVKIIVEENEEYHHSEKQRKNRRKKTNNVTTNSEQKPPIKPSNETIPPTHVAADNTSHQHTPNTEEDNYANASHKSTIIKKKHRKFQEEHSEENHYSEENVENIGRLHNYNFNVKQTENGQQVISDDYFDGKRVTNRELPKGIKEDTVIKLQTLVAHDGSGRCYCTCQTDQKPVFFSVPREKINSYREEI